MCVVPSYLHGALKDLLDTMLCNVVWQNNRGCFPARWFTCSLTCSLVLCSLQESRSFLKHLIATEQLTWASNLHMTYFSRISLFFCLYNKHLQRMVTTDRLSVWTFLYQYVNTTFYQFTYMSCTDLEFVHNPDPNPKLAVIFQVWPRLTEVLHSDPDVGLYLFSPGPSQAHTM